MAQLGLYDDFVAGVAEVMSRVVAGDPHDPDTDIGPLITLAHRDKVAGMVARAPSQGGRVVCRGSDHIPIISEMPRAAWQPLASART